MINDLSKEEKITLIRRWITQNPERCPFVLNYNIKCHSGIDYEQRKQCFSILKLFRPAYKPEARNWCPCYYHGSEKVIMRARQAVKRLREELKNAESAF